MEQGVHDVDPAADHVLSGQARHDNGPAMYEPAGQVVQTPWKMYWFEGHETHAPPDNTCVSMQHIGDPGFE